MHTHNNLALLLLSHAPTMVIFTVGFRASNTRVRQQIIFIYLREAACAWARCHSLLFCLRFHPHRRPPRGGPLSREGDSVFIFVSANGSRQEAPTTFPGPAASCVGPHSCLAFSKCLPDLLPSLLLLPEFKNSVEF